MALPAFSIGLLCAIFNLWCNANGYRRHSEIISEQRRLYAGATSWDHLSKAEQVYQRGKPKADRWHHSAVTVGWGSFIWGVIGAALLACALLLPNQTPDGSRANKETSASHLTPVAPTDRKSVV